jgi:MYXO-CTERM domain-containing protein
MNADAFGCDIGATRGSESWVMLLGVALLGLLGRRQR